MTEAAVLIFFPLLMAVAALSDATTMLISNRISLALALGFAPIAWLVGASPADIALHYSCGFAVFGMMFGMFAFGLIGGGDAKLASATAIWLGWDTILNYGLTTAMLGGFLSIGLLAARKLPLPQALVQREWIARLHDPKSGVPYGVALAVAGLMLYPESVVWTHAVTG